MTNIAFIGLGIMGWADLLFIMGIPYDSQEAIDLADRLMSFVKEKSHDQCAKLAEERGPSTIMSSRKLNQCWWFGA